MLAGDHPRQHTIGAIVEDPDYHERLLDYIRRYRRDPQTSHLVRNEQSLRDDTAFAAAERTFATLGGFVRYCNGLPNGFADLFFRMRRVKSFAIGREVTAKDLESLRVSRRA